MVYIYNTLTRIWSVARSFLHRLSYIALSFMWLASFLLWLHVQDLLPLPVHGVLSWLYKESGLIERIEPWRQLLLDCIVRESLSIGRNFRSLRDHLLVKIDPLDRVLLQDSAKIVTVCGVFRLLVYACNLTLQQSALYKALRQKIRCRRPSLLSKVLPPNVMRLGRLACQPFTLLCLFCMYHSYLLT